MSVSEEFEISSIPQEGRIKFNHLNEGPLSLKPIEIPLESLHSFNVHPFKVIYDKSMQALTASIKENGIIAPLIVRPDGDGYEIISGHRRAGAAREAGLNTVPCMIVDYNDEEATLCMCDSNLQREKLLPSERAGYVYLKYNILDKRRLYGNGNRARRLAKEFGMSEKTIFRCLNLYELGPRIMEAVDDKKLKEASAADKIYPMRKTTQKMLIVAVYEHDISFDDKCLDKILEADRKEELSQEMFDDIVSSYLKEKNMTHNTTKKNPIFSPKILSYFPQSYSNAQVEVEILNLLEQNKDNLHNK